MTLTNTNAQKQGINTNVKIFQQFTPEPFQWIYNRVTNTIRPQFVNRENVNVLITGRLTVVGCIDGVFCPSDKRLKENIREIDNVNLLKLNPVKYNFNYDEQKITHYGLIAQEVEEYFPELVNETYDKLKQTNIKSVNYIELVPMLLKEIQTLNLKMVELERNCKHDNLETMRTCMQVINKLKLDLNNKVPKNSKI
uniref:Peptidase S74 domain-containing protein n=1 Tax=viral metagenome TaxID=1070528 RepID=A0A6C0LK69_9ZZZZ